jgi:hypothetical protein
MPDKPPLGDDVGAGPSPTDDMGLGGELAIVPTLTRMQERPMRPVRALQLILGLSLFATLFSGTLTWRELFGASAMSCPAPGAPGTVFGWPACVYGFFMFVAVDLLAAAGLRGAGMPHDDKPIA